MKTPSGSPEFPNQELSDTEYGPKPLRIGTLLEIFEEEGRSPKFEECFSLWHERMERLAESHEDVVAHAVTMLEIDMFSAQIYLEIGDVASAVELFNSILDNVDNNPRLKLDDTQEKIDLYADIDYLDRKVNEAWEDTQNSNTEE
ncbi:MAG: hypothetical protein WCO09_04035 [bacterium]